MKRKVRIAEEEKIVIPSIKLKWSEWVAWRDVERDVREGGISPPDEPGVYEVRYDDQEERLTIGRASNLRMRVKQGLVKGKVQHPAGKKIRKNEDTSRIVIRWAITDRPAAVEEELLGRYLARFGRLPKYVSQPIHIKSFHSSLSQVLKKLSERVKELMHRGLDEDLYRNLVEAILECGEGHWLASAMIVSRSITYMIEQMGGKRRSTEELVKNLVKIGLIPKDREDEQRKLIMAIRTARNFLAHRVDVYAGPEDALMLLGAAVKLAKIYIQAKAFPLKLNTDEALTRGRAH